MSGGRACEGKEARGLGGAPQQGVIYPVDHPLLQVVRLTQHPIGLARALASLLRLTQQLIGLGQALVQAAEWAPLEP